jgi:hypothetical protein
MAKYTKLFSIYFQVSNQLRTLAHCSQRVGGFAKAGLPLPFMRATNVHFRTAFSAALLPCFRKTDR